MVRVGEHFCLTSQDSRDKNYLPGGLVGITWKTEAYIGHLCPRSKVTPWLQALVGTATFGAGSSYIGSP